jgi:asparagine synthase (glutamine-hydrolysing)
MCGIAGLLDLQGRKAERTLLERMNARLIHRGPDEEGYYINCSAALAQRRLRIIDLCTGKQPLANEDESVWVTFNGEIYNYRELRRDLERTGHRFATQSDTEVIVHAYEQFGKECVKHFRGMFAFGLWDLRQKTLLLARDRVGKKPLYYTVADGQFVFASELQALIQHPGIRREPDPVAIDQFLTYGYIPAPRTIYRNVFKLPPASLLTVRLNEGGASAYDLGTERYWQLEYAPKQSLSETEAVEATLEKLTEAVRLRLVADVPLGALLSGGIDSSLVVAIMSRLSSQPVRTFSIGFDEREFDELPYARMVAERYGTDHHEMIVRPDALEVLPQLVRHYGEPYADSSAIPSYYVARMTRQHVTVALNGDGGDECFGGYERYLGNNLASVYRRVPRLLRRGLIEPLSRCIPEGLPRRHLLRKAKRFVRDASLPQADCYAKWVTFVRPEQKRELYTPQFKQQLGDNDGERWLLEEAEAVRKSGLDGLDTVLALDVRSYLPFDLLVKMDIATMANSLEARSPFLDHELMEFAARLPSHYKVRGRVLKYLLKEVGRELLPPPIMQRRKMGFGVPVGAWIQGQLRPLLDDLLLSERSARRGYFQVEYVRQLAASHAEGKQENTSQLWALLCLELWHREIDRL